MSKSVKRKANKLRKAEAFLKVARANDKDRRDLTNITMDPWKATEVGKNTVKSSDEDSSSCDEKKKRTLTLEERMQKAREEFRARQKASMERPKLILDLDSLNPDLPDEARHYRLASTSGKAHPMLFVSDIQQLLLYVIQGNLASYKPRWCKLLRWTKVTKLVVVNVDGISSTEYQQYAECLPNLNAVYDMSLELVSPTQYGGTTAADLFRVPMSPYRMKRKREELEKEERRARKRMKVDHGKVDHSETSLSDSTPGGTPARRTDIILSPLQLIQEGYPIPVVSGQHQDYVHSKESYEEVTDKSPLFAVDCEMCMTCKGQLELTWVSVVDEELNLVYDTLVKPHNPISNYLTKYSGITKDMLANVTTRLSDVQKALRDILPADAILCGQSLDGDLRALKLFHPYVIDTSIIFNLSGQRGVKAGLRRLTNTFLGRDIQNDDKKGHNPTEDAIATMELVNLKLKMGLGFGDVILGGELEREAYMAAAAPCLPQPSIAAPASTTSSVPSNKAQPSKATPLTKSSHMSNTGSKVPNDTEATSSSEEEEKSSRKSELPTSVNQRKKFFMRPGTDMHESMLSLAKEAGKSVTLVDRETCLSDRLEEAVCQMCHNDKAAVKTALRSHGDHFMTYIHFHHPDTVLSAETPPTEEAVKKCMKKLDKRLKRVICSLPERSIMAVIFGGRSSQQEEFHHAMGFVKVL